MRRVLLAMSCAVATGVVVVGARQDPAFRAAAHTVSVFATVVDAAGRLVPNLTRDDFEVLDNGTPQALTVFDNADQPITSVVMLDRSGSMAGNFDLVRDAAQQFVAHLTDADRARVGTFSTHIQIDPETFTSDRVELARILRGKLQEAGPTPLWNATAAAMTALNQASGRRVVVVFTDGYDSPWTTDGNVSYEQVSLRSQTEEVMVYAIGLAERCGGGSPAAAFADPRSEDTRRFQGRGPTGTGPGRGGPGQGGPGRGGPTGRGVPLGPGRVGIPVGPGRGLPIPGIPGRGVPGAEPGRDDPFGTGRDRGDTGGPCDGAKPDPELKTLALDGGGGYFELHGTDNLAATFTRVVDELHHQYLLAFRPGVLDGQSHTITVRTRRGDLTVRARKTYLAAR